MLRCFWVVWVFLTKKTEDFKIEQSELDLCGDRNSLQLLTASQSMQV